jgi:hypothetical protein
MPDAAASRKRQIALPQSHLQVRMRRAASARWRICRIACLGGGFGALLCVRPVRRLWGWRGFDSMSPRVGRFGFSRIVVPAAVFRRRCRTPLGAGTIEFPVSAAAFTSAGRPGPLSVRSWPGPTFAAACSPTLL